jgi:hypothetical protein
MWIVYHVIVGWESVSPKRPFVGDFLLVQVILFSYLALYVLGLFLSNQLTNPLQDTAEGMLRSVLVKIFEIAGGSIDHIPPVMYEFEINCSKKVDDRENVYARVTNMPSLINLSN